MKSALTLLVVLSLIACERTNTGTGSGNRPGQGTGSGAGCESPVSCVSDCDDLDPECLRGTLDRDACACVADDGTSTPMPTKSVDVLRLAELAFEPLIQADVPAGSIVPLKVLATWNNAVTKDVTSASSIMVDPSDAAEPADGGWRILRTGRVTFQASFSFREETLLAAVTVNAPAAGEARAVWVTRFAFRTEADVRRVINAAADAHFNVVFFQVRGLGDAYYNSSLEPWTARFTGTLGQDPGWDPLQVAIDTAHARGIELHAYFNAFTAWTDGTPPPASPAGSPNHALVDHPDWLEVDSSGKSNNDGYVWFAPGVDEVRAHNTAVARELLTNYAVDGLHLDRIRYSESDMGHNAIEWQSYLDSGEPDFDAWRVSRVNDQVHQIFDVIREVRPSARLSAAVWGIHTILPGCGTSAGKRDLYQDSWAWIEGGYIDALAPMIYWADGTGCTDYSALLDTFMEHRGNGQIWAGMHVLDKDPSCSGNCLLDFTKLSRRIDVVREKGAAGMTMFASAYLDPDPKNGNQSVWDLLLQGPFASEASVPARGP